MKEEIEIQVILKNPKEVEEKLKEFFIKEKKQKDEYFVPKHEDFFCFRKTFKIFKSKA